MLVPRHISRSVRLLALTLILLGISGFLSPVWGQIIDEFAQSSPQLNKTEQGAEQSKEVSADQQLSEKIQGLVKRLGHRSFAIREQAEQELLQIGKSLKEKYNLGDYLFAAMLDKDREIALRAKYIASGLEIDWADPEFEKEVRSILARYGTLDEGQRASRIEKLARLGSFDAVKGLIRISRLDLSEVLSKKAALELVINFPLDKESRFRTEIPALIDKELFHSNRVGPTWLKVYRESADDISLSVDNWKKLIRAEFKTIALESKLTNRQIIQDLIRWEIKQLRELGRQDEALAEMRNIINISDVPTAELMNITTWLLEQQGYSVVEELANHHRDPQQPDAKLITGRFAEEPMLLYLLAEAHLMQKQIDQANQVADQAFGITPEVHISHFLSARSLRDRGLFRWSKREFTSVFDSLEDSEDVARLARRQMAEMIHDQGDHAEAAKIMEPLVEAVKQLEHEGRVRPRSDEEEEFNGIKARYHFFLAKAAEKAGNKTLQKDELRKAIQNEKDEADVLIAIYKLKDDEEWKKFAELKLTESMNFMKPMVDKFETQINSFKKNRPSIPIAEILGATRSVYATTLNQYAWAVSNTTGDKDHAIRMSLLSLELSPGEPAYLDTLAHCYFAVGDLKNCVRTQEQAVVQLPHSKVIRKKYHEFVTAYQKEDPEYQAIELPLSPDVNFPEE